MDLYEKPLDTGLVCDLCKNKFHMLSKLGTKTICGNCDRKIRKNIFQEIDPMKLNFISHLEADMLIDIFFLSEELGWNCEFQKEIRAQSTICALEEYYDCPEGCGVMDGNNVECWNCKFSHSKSYVKYILDFALIRGDIKIDLELDGWHFHKDRRIEDKQRDNYMNSFGWITYRIPSKEIFKNKNQVIEELRKFIEKGDDDGEVS